MSENKKPMSKAKKTMIAYIISIVTGVLILAAGIIMETTGNSKTDLTFIFGIIIAALGALLLGMSIYGTAVFAKKVKAEK